MRRPAVYDRPDTILSPTEARQGDGRMLSSRVLARSMIIAAVVGVVVLAIYAAGGFGSI